MTTSAVNFFAIALVFPLLVSVGMTYSLREGVRRHLRNRPTAAAPESDVRNENLEPELDSLSYILIFSLLFNFLFLLVELPQLGPAAERYLTLYIAAMVCFLVALFIDLSFVLRFFQDRFVRLGIALAALGSIAMTAAAQLGSVVATSTGTSTGSATGALLTAKYGGYPYAFIVPAILALVSWALAVCMFVANARRTHPEVALRIPHEGPYRVFISALALGWVGILLICVHTLLTYPI